MRRDLHLCCWWRMSDWYICAVSLGLYYPPHLNERTAYTETLGVTFLDAFSCFLPLSQTP